MNSRSKSEDPVRLIQLPLRQVPTNGFRILEGFTHIQRGRRLAVALPKRFVVPNPGGTFKRVRYAADLYLEFAMAPVQTISVLHLASEYGCLGRSRHFHDGNGRAASGETLDEWLTLISRIKFWLEAWLAISNRDTVRAKQLLWDHLGRDLDVRIHGILKSGKPIELLREHLLREINQRLNPGLQTIGPCGYPGCKYKHPPMLAAHVRQAIHIDLNCRRTARGPQIDFVLSPYDLRSALWLQFANAITGNSVIKRCELCGEFMDVTSSARPGAKRMHNHCSHAARMRRYRRRKAE